MCFSLTSTEPELQRHQHVEGDGFNEQHSETQDGQGHHVHLQIDLCVCWKREKGKVNATQPHKEEKMNSCGAGLVYP